MKKFLTAVLLVAMTMLAVIPVPMYADELQEYQQQNYHLKNEIDRMLQQKRNAEQEKTYLEWVKENLEMEETKQEKKQEKLQFELQDIEEVSKSFNEQLEASIQEYNESIEKLKNSLRFMYENSMSSVLDLFFQSKSIMDFFERVDLMRIMVKANRVLIDRLRVLKRDIEFKSSIKNQELAMAGNMIIEQGERIESIRVSRDDVEDNIRGADLDIKGLERQIDQFNAESRRITEKIKQLQSQQKYVGGEMAWPLPSCHSVGSPFGMRWHPILGKNKMHTGVDIGGVYGASIIAANGGTVIYAGWQSGYGYTVIIDHGVLDGKSVTTLYAHCSSILVKSGQGVKKEQIIAKVGSTGLSTGPHLHFEVRENGEPVNPINNKYLKKN